MADPSIFTVSFSKTAVTAAVDLFEVTPGDDKPVTILGWSITQSSDFGDAQAEQIGYRVIKGFTTSGSGGASATPRSVVRNAITATFAAETCNTTVATTGTTMDIYTGSINMQAGEYVWLPEGCDICVSQADTSLVLRLTDAPADSLSISGTLWVRELG